MSDIKDPPGFWKRRERTQKEFETSFVKTDHLADVSLFDRINWLNCIIVFGVPLLALYGLLTLHNIMWQTWVWAVIYYFWSGLGITAGYHRLWSHKSYTASFPLECWLCFGGSGALQGSVKWWSLLHRAHHRWTDTESDPYNSMRGFVYSHVGWLLLDQIRIEGHVPMDDLKRNPLVQWQHRHYSWFGPFTAFIVPTLIAWLFWGDLRGGFYIAGALRLCIVHHATWCVNSVAHWFGEQTFDDTVSPRDHIITGLLTLGEGYHNFHHEFPHDYRNGIHWYDYDPTKWFIYTMNCLGLASDLHKFPQNEIAKGELDMKAKQLVMKRRQIDYGIDIETLPIWTHSEWIEAAERAKKERRVLVVESDIVYDVTHFVNEDRHPGGKAMILSRRGKDITSDFNGMVYNHTNAARNLMSHWRLARMQRE